MYHVSHVYRVSNVEVPFPADRVDCRQIGGWLVLAVLFAIFLPSATLAQSDLVSFRLQTSNLQGSPIASANYGDQFLLQGFVQDLTNRENGGVFAAYLDVRYDAQLVSVSGEVTWGPDYSNVTRADLSKPGLINEIGAVDGLQPLGPNELILFSIPMTTKALGTAVFSSEPADVSPLHDVLLWGNPLGTVNGVVHPDRIDYRSTSLTIVPEPSGATLLAWSLLSLCCFFRK